ncbi:hypothetical protein FHS68_004203 [Dyadobacter arcticus]|uniref:Uncharacterized protein n=1 Tax=Dyadobacter arcticus TaxID=1078754 RepID=A0ABX0UPW9_9BACT|nr:hypothetical protein [Dyadobacter arcticus]
MHSYNLGLWIFYLMGIGRAAGTFGDFLFYLFTGMNPGAREIGRASGTLRCNKCQKHDRFPKPGFQPGEQDKIAA